MRRIAAITALMTVLACSAAAEVAKPLTDAQLAQIRGGYLSANGLTFGFGATVSTYVNGALALQSQLTLTDTGPVLSQTGGSAAGVTAFDPASAQALGLSGLVGKGVILEGDGGASTIVHNLTGDQILSVVVNAASNRTLTQNTALTLTLPAFNQLQQATAAQQLSAQLLSAVGVGATLRH